MKVKIVSTGNVEDYNESYARRLVCMGEAVLAEPEKPKKAVAVEIVEKLPEAEEKPAKAAKPVKSKKTK